MDNNIVQRIDLEIENHSLLKHSFYKMWSEGKLTIDHLQGYSKEYFQLVKVVPKFVERIAEASGNSDDDIITNNAREEAEHVELWAFRGAILSLMVAQKRLMKLSPS